MADDTAFFDLPRFSRSQGHSFDPNAVEMAFKSAASPFDDAPEAIASVLPAEVGNVDLAPKPQVAEPTDGYHCVLIVLPACPDDDGFVAAAAEALGVQLRAKPPRLALKVSVVGFVPPLSPLRRILLQNVQAKRVAAAEELSRRAVVVCEAMSAPQMRAGPLHAPPSSKIYSFERRSLGEAVIAELLEWSSEIASETTDKPCDGITVICAHPVYTGPAQLKQTFVHSHEEALLRCVADDTRLPRHNIVLSFVRTPGSAVGTAEVSAKEGNSEVPSMMVGDPDGEWHSSSPIPRAPPLTRRRVFLAVVDPGSVTMGLPRAAEVSLQRVAPGGAIILHGVVSFPDAAVAVQLSHEDWTSRLKTNLSAAKSSLTNVKTQLLRSLTHRKVAAVTVGVVVSDRGLVEGVRKSIAAFGVSEVVLSHQLLRGIPFLRGPSEMWSGRPAETVMRLCAECNVAVSFST